VNFENNKLKVHSHPQDLRAETMNHDLTRDWPTGRNKKAPSPEMHHRLAVLTPLQRWQAESMRDQPYHNLQAVRLKECGGVDGPSQHQGSSVGYFDPSEHKDSGFENGEGETYFGNDGILSSGMQGHVIAQEQNSTNPLS
jgi:hypothetical protein